MTSWLVQNALLVVPLAAGAAIVCRVLRPRPAVCHALWLVVLVKLLVPPLPLWSAQWLDRLVAYESLAPWQPINADAIPLTPMGAAKSNLAGRARVTEVIVVEPRKIPTEQDSHRTSPTSRVSTKQSPAKLSDVRAESDQEPAIASTSTWASVRLAILLLWAVGAGLAVVCHLRRVIRLRRALRSSAPAAEPLSREVALQCSRIGITVPRVLLCTGLPCPMVFALPRATLLWPASLENRLVAAGVRAVLVHELAHLKRRDHLTAWLEIAVGCFWWWHPVVWWARRELRAYAELACDAWVVAQLPGERSHYARALVDVCEFISLAKPASAPAVGMARGNRGFFERRLHMILRQRIATRMPLLAWLAILAVALLVLPGFSTGQVDTSGSDPNAAQSNTKSGGWTDSAAEKPGISKAVRSLIGGGHELEPKVLELQKWIVRARGKGRSSTMEERQKTQVTLQATTRLMRSSEFPDKDLVTEIYLQILGRQPRPHEASHWLKNLRANEFDVGDLVENLLRSSEFVDGPPQGDKPTTAVRPPLVMPEPARSRQAPAQTLLRVVYDMPRDKGEALARFLKDQVEEGHIDVRTVETGLVVTAHANIQRTIVGVVSLMLGEPITLDLGDMPPIGNPMRSHAFQQPGGPYVGMTTYVPAAVGAQPASPGDDAPHYAPRAGRIIVPRIVVEPGTGTERTVYEERVYNGESKTDDLSSPRLTPSSTGEAKTHYPKEPPPRP